MLAEFIIARACRRLPDELREEQFAEWSAELPAILSDTSRRFYLHRAWTALCFALGHFRGVRRLGSSAARPLWHTPLGQLLAKAFFIDTQRPLAKTSLISSIPAAILEITLMDGVPRIVFVSTTLASMLFRGSRSWWSSRNRRARVRKSVAE